MATKKKRAQKSQGKGEGAAVETDLGAPTGRGGVAMGRTVGLPFGGGRPRKRKTSAKRVSSKPK
jgi:hypothetical protein